MHAHMEYSEYKAIEEDQGKIYKVQPNANTVQDKASRTKITHNKTSPFSECWENDMIHISSTNQIDISNSKAPTPHKSASNSYIQLLKSITLSHFSSVNKTIEQWLMRLTLRTLAKLKQQLALEEITDQTTQTVKVLFTIHFQNT